MTNPETVETLKKIATTFGGSEPALLHLFWLFRGAFRGRNQVPVRTSKRFLKYLHSLEEFGLIKVLGGKDEGPDLAVRDCAITETGHNFRLRLMLHPGIKEAPEYEFPEVRL
jgi:hypothetical protein